MKKLYIVEGIPGSGKTTFAKTLASKLEEIYGTAYVRLFVEGDLHPADMAWCALLSKDEYSRLLKEHTNLAESIKNNTTPWRDCFTVAYTKINDLPEELYSFFESKEVYDNRISADTFCEIHKDRWSKFGQEAENITVFECSLLQNAINELCLFHKASENDILKYIETLLDSVKSLKPEIIYLDINPQDSINRAAEERVDDLGNRVWEERVTDYICNSPFGKQQGYQGSQGMTEYFAYRQQMEKRIMDRLHVEKCIIKIDITNQQEQTDKAIKQIISLNGE